MPGYYGFRLTKDGAAVTWRDSNQTAFYYNPFAVLGGIYDGTTASYIPPLKIVYYDSVWAVA